MIVQRVLLIGNHPISRDIEGQFAQQGAEVLRADFPQAGAPLADVGGGRIGRVDALCLFSAPDTESDNEADNCCLDLLKRLATEEAATTGVELKREDGQRIVCHLLLQSQTTLWALQNFDLPEAVNQMFDVYAFTMEDQWAKAAFASVGGRGRCCPPLDREAITEHSPKRVHLVLIGWNEATESLAIHAALVSHFPNYVGNHQLRTRITIVDERMDERADAFIGRYHHLFDNSYYRRLDLTKESPRTAFHAPRYNGQRDEFVDIEWEFVKAGSYHPLLREKLALWAADRTQVLTVALCHVDDACNANEAFCLPDAIYDHAVTVLPYVHQRGIFALSQHDSRFSNVYPIGMEDCGYDISLPLMNLAKRLNYFYNCQFVRQAVPTSLPEDEVEEDWKAVDSYAMRFSSLYNAMTMTVKMRSLGHDEGDWGQFYAVTQAETELLSAVEHNRWSVERLILGFRPPTDSERDEIRENIRAILQAKKEGTPVPEDLKKAYKRRRIHYDLCSYEELDLDSSGQDVRIYDYALTACIPLIMNSFNGQQS